HGCTGGVRGARLQAVRAQRVEEVEAHAEGIALGGAPVDFAESELLVEMPRNDAEIARQNALDGFALRRRGGCGAADEPAVLDGAGARDAGSDRKVTPRDIGVEEVEEL